MKAIKFSDLNLIEKIMCNIAYFILNKYIIRDSSKEKINTLNRLEMFIFTLIFKLMGNKNEPDRLMKVVIDTKDIFRKGDKNQFSFISLVMFTLDFKLLEYVRKNSCVEIISLIYKNSLEKACTPILDFLKLIWSKNFYFLDKGIDLIYSLKESVDPYRNRRSYYDISYMNSKKYTDYEINKIYSNEYRETFHNFDNCIIKNTRNAFFRFINRIVTTLENFKNDPLLNFKNSLKNYSTNKNNIKIKFKNKNTINILFNKYAFYDEDGSCIRYQNNNIINIKYCQYPSNQIILRNSKFNISLDRKDKNVIISLIDQVLIVETKNRGKIININLPHEIFISVAENYVHIKYKNDRCMNKDIYLKLPMFPESKFTRELLQEDNQKDVLRAKKIRKYMESNKPQKTIKNKISEFKFKFKRKEMNHLNEKKDPFLKMFNQHNFKINKIMNSFSR